MTQQKREWKAPCASRFGTFAEATAGLPNPGEGKLLGTEDEFAPSLNTDWTPIL